MKTRYLLPAIFALGSVGVSSQTFADLTYDPCCNYYSEYYGTGIETKAAPIKIQKKAQQKIQKKAQENETYEGPFSTYYNTYYSADQVNSEVSLDEYPDMADPTNYFKW